MSIGFAWTALLTLAASAPGFAAAAESDIEHSLRHAQSVSSSNALEIRLSPEAPHITIDGYPGASASFELAKETQARAVSLRLEPPHRLLLQICFIDGEGNLLECRASARTGTIWLDAGEQHAFVLNDGRIEIPSHTRWLLFHQPDAWLGRAFFVETRSAGVVKQERGRVTSSGVAHFKLVP
jgi:hypothetical protein